MLNGKTILLGVTGGIAAYKAAALASALVKQHATVEVIMTAHATQFITPLTFEQLTGRRCMVDTFDRNFPHQVEHIALADRTDLVLIARPRRPGHHRSSYRQCVRQAGPRSGGRHADHDCAGLHRPKTRRTGHEYEDV